MEGEGRTARESRQHYFWSLGIEPFFWFSVRVLESLRGFTTINLPDRADLGPLIAF